MNEYAVRISIKSNLTTEMVFQWAKDNNFYSYICSKEYGKDGLNPHCHLFIMDSVKKQCLDKRIISFVRQFDSDNKGNKAYTNTVCRDKLKYIAYIIKDTYDQTLYNISDDIMENARKYDETVKEEIKQLKKKGTILNQLEEKCERLDTFEEVVRQILIFHIDTDKTINQFKIKDYANTIMIRKSGINAERFVQLIARENIW